MRGSWIRRTVLAIAVAATATVGCGWVLHGTVAGVPTAVAQSDGSFYVWIMCPGFKRQQIWGPYSYDHAWSVVRQAEAKGCQARVSTDDGSPRRPSPPVPPHGGHR